MNDNQLIFELYHENGKKFTGVRKVGSMSLYYTHGQLDRKDGPAKSIAGDSNSFAWFIDGVRYKTPELYAKAVLKLANKPHDHSSVDHFLRLIFAKQTKDLI